MARMQLQQTNILRMDEILHPEKPQNDDSPGKYQQTVVSHGFKVVGQNRWYPILGVGEFTTHFRLPILVWMGSRSLGATRGFGPWPYVLGTGLAQEVGQGFQAHDVAQGLVRGAAGGSSGSCPKGCGGPPVERLEKGYQLFSEPSPKKG